MSGRPWIIHDGSGCPVSEGTMVEVIRRNGTIHGPFPALTQSIDSFGRIGVFVHSGYNSWVWNDGSPRSHVKIIAYRLSDTDDKAKREARMESFRKMAQPNDLDIRPVKAPQKVGAAQ